MRKLIVFELNEVPFKVSDRFAAAHPRSAFARVLPEAAQFVGRTPDTIHLHPRISWPTFHRGVPDRVHGILEFNKDTSEPDRLYPHYWPFTAAILNSFGVPVPDYMPDIPDSLARCLS